MQAVVEPDGEYVTIVFPSDQGGKAMTQKIKINPAHESQVSTSQILDVSEEAKEEQPFNDEIDLRRKSVLFAAPKRHDFSKPQMQSSSPPSTAFAGEQIKEEFEENNDSFAGLGDAMDDNEQDEGGFGEEEFTEQQPEDDIIDMNGSFGDGGMIVGADGAAMDVSYISGGQNSFGGNQSFQDGPDLYGQIAAQEEYVEQNSFGEAPEDGLELQDGEQF